jgi:hypothetical protein
MKVQLPKSRIRCGESVEQSVGLLDKSVGLLDGSVE